MIGVDTVRHISGQSPTGTCSPLTHVKYEQAKGANSHWSDLLPITCNVVPLMLILRKTKLRKEMKVGEKQSNYTGDPVFQTMLADHLLCIEH
jgi:hypothetical protein